MRLEKASAVNVGDPADREEQQSYAGQSPLTESESQTATQKKTVRKRKAKAKSDE